MTIFNAFIRTRQPDRSCRPAPPRDGQISQSDTSLGPAKRWGMERLLTADELAERLGMKTDWVWAQAPAGRIPHVRLGRYRRFRESAVEEWLREIETGGSGRTASTQSRAIPLRRRA
jgi:excisionase family DNA binding protein